MNRKKTRTWRLWLDGRVVAMAAEEAGIFGYVRKRLGLPGIKEAIRSGHTLTVDRDDITSQYGK